MKKITNIDVINTAWKVILILAVIAVLLQITYIFAIKKKKMKKRKFRTAIAVYSGLVIGLITVLIVSSFVLKFGYLNKSTIDRELMESDYFSGVTQTIREIGKRELKTAGYDEEIAEDIFKLSSVYIPEKQYIRNLLEKGRDKSEISTDKIYAALVQQINKGSKGENEKLIKKLEKVYKLGLSFKFGDGIYKCMKEFNNTFIIIMISSIVSLLLMAYLLSKMYGYKHKAVRVYSFAILASSLVSLVLVLITKVKNIEESIVVSPVFYQNFMTKYIAWNIKIGIYIGLIGILVGVALFFVKNYLHRLYVE